MKKGREAGGVWKLYKRLRSKNACKTCALGMGGQEGGMVNEAGHFPEVCKKSVQAQAGDMAGAIREDFFAQNSIAGLRTLSSAALQALGRLAFPILAEPGATHFRRCSWEEAFERTARALSSTSPDRAFFYSSGRSSNEAAFLFQLVARAYGTANVHNCSFYCHNASSVALQQIYGSGTASVVLDDLKLADFALVVGANPASNHPRLITQLIHLRKRGGRVVVINPLRELGLERFRLPSEPMSLLRGSQVSDLYLQPHVGADVPLLVALLKGVVERGGLDRAFVDGATAGFSEVERAVAASSWDELVAACGVPRAEIDRAVGLFLEAKRGIFLWAMGLTHHAHGVDNILALANLALARGWLGKPGTGLLPIRGHSNVQGVGSVGVSPQLKKVFAERLATLYGVDAAQESGQDTYSSMVAASEGKVDAAVLFGGNLYASNPDSTWTAAAMRKIGLTFAATTHLNEGHAHGNGMTSIVVPVLARDEESQTTSQESMFNYVRLSEGGTPAVEGDLKSEVDIIASLAERILPAGRFDWTALRSHQRLREEIARAVPGFAALADLEATKKEFQIEGRTFHDMKFGTPDGKAHFHVTPVAPFDPGEAGDFRLMTLRSEGQFNTVVYDVEDLYRGNAHRDVVMMAEEDATRLGIREGDRVRVATEIGAMEVEAAFVPIRAGNLAMYYPEANAIVPRKLDPKSKTPAFKSMSARLERCPTAG
jgi:molybdopterin-dependent oxidoreductase alpha subunit